MAVDQRAGQPLAPDAPSLPTAAILAICDRLLSEVGRRQHLFAWLRAPDAGAGEWLAVDAYYPAHRLVVVCHLAPDPLYAELVPSHGLRLLMVEPSELGADPAHVRLTLERQIADLQLPERVVPATPEPERTPVLQSVVSKALASLAPPPPALTPALRRPASAAQAAAAERALRFVATHPVAKPAPRTRSEGATGLLFGLAIGLVGVIALAIIVAVLLS